MVQELQNGKRRGAAQAATVACVVLAGTAFVVTEALAQKSNRQQSQRSQAEWADSFDTSIRDQAQVKSVLPTLSPQTAAYLEWAIARYQAIVSRGGWEVVSTKKALRVGSRSKAVVALRRRLMVSGDLSKSAGLSSTFDSYVGLAVKRFQARHGITPDGIAGRATIVAMNVPAEVRLRQLETNLVRVRSMSGFLGDRYAMVNIPAAEIEAVENGRVRTRHTAVVGKIDRQSPLINSKIHEINFNPYWHVPVSIIRKDLIPKMKEDPEYLTRNNIRIYKSHGGEELAVHEVDWDTDEATNYLFRQEPGEINSLGSVRINFHNKHAVYMHDTPSKSLFGDDYRFVSSGCVRVQNVREFVTWLLSDTEGWSRARVDQEIRSGERLDVQLTNKIPIYWVYVTAWANADGIIHFREDIYNRDGLAPEPQNDELASTSQ